MENRSEQEKLAREALEDARIALMMTFRFLDISLWRMPWAPLSCGRALATNGGALYFDPRAVLASYLEDENALVRDLLHSILHCILRHPFDSSHADRLAWSTACDIAVESIAMQMCGKRFRCENDAARQQAVEKLESELGSLTPQKIYRALKSGGAGDPGVSNAEISKLHRLFIRDSHDVWAMWREEDDSPNNGDAESGSLKASFEDDGGDDASEVFQQSSIQDDAQQKASHADKEDGDPSAETENENHEQSGSDDGASPDEDSQSDEQGEKDEKGSPSDQHKASSENQDETNEPQSEQGDECNDDRDSNSRSDDDSDDDLTPQDAPTAEDEQAWEEIGQQMQIDLETFSKDMGVKSSNFMVNLSIANHKQVDYADFLRRFTALVEETRINDDEFDYIFYTLGLERYGNMPLVEPLEYQEVERVREFVIAIDTSGSCSGALVKAFLQQTHDILCESDRFGENMNVHVIQCDSRIQFDTAISSVEEFEDMERSFTLRGFGGTDFRPVFEYVDELIKQGEFTNLKGLIYFTDGIGTYPTKPPDYNVAFAFVGDASTRRSVPPWAMKVVIDEDSLMEMA